MNRIPIGDTGLTVRPHEYPVGAPGNSLIVEVSQYGRDPVRNKPFLITDSRGSGYLHIDNDDAVTLAQAILDTVERVDRERTLAAVEVELEGAAKAA